MKTKIPKPLLVFIISAASIFLSRCSVPENIIAEEFSNISDNTWKWNDSKSFTFTIKDSNHYNNFYIGLRINGTYAYSNLWIISQIQGNNTNLKEQIQISIADQTGRWLGKGMSNLIIYNQRVGVKKKLAPGTYTWTLSQNMRDEKLLGIADVGIKIDKGQQQL